MSRDKFKARKIAFEYEFCHKVDQQLLQRLRNKLHSDDRLPALADATGIED